MPSSHCRCRMAPRPPSSMGTRGGCGGDNATTPQLHNFQLPIPNELPTSNSQNSQHKKRRNGLGLLPLDVGFLPWAFWELRLGNLLGFGSCGVGEFRNCGAAELTR